MRGRNHKKKSLLCVSLILGFRYGFLFLVCLGFNDKVKRLGFKLGFGLRLGSHHGSKVLYLSLVG